MTLSLPVGFFTAVDVAKSVKDGHDALVVVNLKGNLPAFVPQLCAEPVGHLDASLPGFRGQGA